MTPEEIVSRIHPEERTQALAAFIAIDRIEWTRTSKIKCPIVQLNHYIQLLDSLVAKANASFGKDRANAVPPAVTAQAPITLRHCVADCRGCCTLPRKGEKSLSDRS
ncbi:hypothetical protein P3W85_28250 [Cupriavidus basilensis]|uniref:Uncharacterized protein n=1 Tax=Cupriavidus basilensis TaxID=68895 RepID=A0ABT6AW05_9BURK|nr:hypothetical protein [Cupriavidus basilensis]MDF3836813.1 hypothetical protein [Cupriavidus basilensis]